VKVNGKRLDIPSYQVAVGDKIELTENARKFKPRRGRRRRRRQA
jgi:small subunit ribosomal protein S4